MKPKARGVLFKKLSLFTQISRILMLKLSVLVRNLLKIVIFDHPKMLRFASSQGVLCLQVVFPLTSTVVITLDREGVIW